MKTVTLILIMALPLLSFAQNSRTLNQPIILNEDSIGIADSLVLEQSANQTQVSILYVTIFRDITKKEKKEIKKQFGKSLHASVEVVTQYDIKRTEGNNIVSSNLNESINEQNHLEMAAFYLEESARLKNSSLTFGLIGMGVGVGLGFVSPPVAAGALLVTGVVFIVMRYKSNKMTKLAAKELRLAVE